jgi:hypothetical protein
MNQLITHSKQYGARTYPIESATSPTVKPLSVINHNGIFRRTSSAVEAKK